VRSLRASHDDSLHPGISRAVLLGPPEAHSEPARQPAQARLSEDGMIVDSKQGLSFTGTKGQLGALCNRRRCASVSRGVQRGLEIRPARRPEQSPTSARRWAWVSSSNQRDTTARRTRAQGGSRSSTG
ncbi:hypothetical protein DHA2_150417, partial [Giardia duodenalis]